MHKILLTMLLLLQILPALSQKIPFQLPPELKTEYGVIAPLCFQRFIDNTTRETTLNLKTAPCLKFTKPYNAYGLKNGLLGYDVDSSDGGMKMPYIFYRYIGSIRDNDTKTYLFLINWSGGGTGSFSQLVRMRLDQSVLSVQETIAGGDRCNGGIKQADIQDNHLLYQVNMTPYALYDLKKSKQNIKLINEIYDCAVCCIGTIHYQDKQRVGVQFNGELQPTHSPESKQACFNRIIDQFGANQKAYIGKDKLNQLLTLLHDKC